MSVKEYHLIVFEYKFYYFMKTMLNVEFFFINWLIVHRNDSKDSLMMLIYLNFLNRNNQKDEEIAAFLMSDYKKYE